MIIQLDHYRKSNSRAIVDSYYSQQTAGTTAPESVPAKVLYTPWHPAPRLSDNGETITTPEQR